MINLILQNNISLMICLFSKKVLLNYLVFDQEID